MLAVTGLNKQAKTTWTHDRNDQGHPAKPATLEFPRRDFQAGQRALFTDELLASVPTAGLFIPLDKQ